MATVGDVRVKISANAQAVTSALQRAGGAFKKFAGVATKAIKIATVALTGLGAAAVAAATTFEGAARKIQAGTGATGAQLARLKADFGAVFSGVPEAAGTVADAIANLNTLFGAEGKELQGLAKQILDFSRLTGGDAAQNSLQFGRAMKQFGVNARDSTDLLDTFFKITQETGIGFERLTRDLREFGPVLKLANIGADEGARLIGRLSKEGINFTRVSPALRQGFINFAKEGKNAREELAKYIDRVKAAGSEGEATKILTEAFGTEVGRLAVAMRSGAFELDEATQAMDRNRGAIAKVEKETRTFGDEMGILKNKIVTALKPAGDAFLLMFRAVLPKITKFIEEAGRRMPDIVLGALTKIAQFIAKFGPGFIQAFNGIVAAVKALGLVLIPIVIAIQFLRETKALNQAARGVEGAADRAQRIRESIEGLKTAWSDMKNSIGDNFKAMGDAQEKANQWAAGVERLRDNFQETLEKEKELVKETENVEKSTKQALENQKKLKQPTQQFIGTIEVAGKAIDVSLNNKLDLTAEKLRTINQLARQAANTMGAAG